MTFSRSSPNRSLASVDSRARIQLMLPRSVLISPLWQMIRYGWASSQLGNVFVEKREWTSATAVLKRSSPQVRVVARQLRAREHALVDDRLRAEARDREVVARLALDHAADHVDLALERVLVAVRAACRRRPGGSSARPPPRSGPAPSGRPGRRASRAASGPRPRSCARSAPRARAGAPRRRAAGRARRPRTRPAGGSSKSSTARKNSSGTWQQDARAVARVDLGAARAAVLEVVEHVERARDRLVLLSPVEVGNRADAAVVVLVAWVVEASGLGSLSHGVSQGRSAARPEGRSELTIVPRDRRNRASRVSARAGRSTARGRVSSPSVASRRSRCFAFGLDSTRRAVDLDAVPVADSAARSARRRRSRPRLNRPLPGSARFVL